MIFVLLKSESVHKVSMHILICNNNVELIYFFEFTLSKFSVKCAKFGTINCVKDNNAAYGNTFWFHYIQTLGI